MDRFVAEIAIPAPVHMPISERKALDAPSYYGCERAYWRLDTELDSNGTARPLGVRLTAELQASNLESAEDAALHVGLRFSQVLAAYSGSPTQTPKLKRIGRIGESEGLFDQYDYFYLEGPDALPRVGLRPYHLEKLLSWFGAFDEPTAYRLELAARWYGNSVGAQDPLDGYLAAWIGLESVGSIFGDQVHEYGPKVACNVCGNETGIDRNRGEAGIQHSVKAVAPEILQRYSIVDLKRLRDVIAHGLKPAQPLRLAVRESLPDLQLALIFAVITTARPDSYAPRSGRAILPRDFKVYPEGRTAVRSQVELIYHRPYYGEWLEVTRLDSQQRSRIEPDGNYVWGAQTRVVIKGD